jgi:AcrR family transcriptional regulator
MEQQRRENKNNKRPQVMAAAMRLFAYYGFDGTSHDMIAKEAGVAKSAIGRLFGTKEKLAARCLNEFVERFVQQVAQAGRDVQSYEEQTAATALLFKKHRAEWRFILSLMLTPAHEELTRTIWSKTFRDKLAVLDPFKQEITEAHFAELPYLIMGTHISYVVGGNEELYERSRQSLLRQFLDKR